MTKALKFFATCFLAYIFYLILAAFTGSLGLWSLEELITGAVLATIASLLAQNVLFKHLSFRLLNPVRFVLFLIYLIGPFFYAMAKANLDVAYRVITGNINPGIVKIDTDLDTDFGITMLANSITLTPGTLTVHVNSEDRGLYVHWINVTDKQPSSFEVCGNFPKWARRVGE